MKTQKTTYKTKRNFIWLLAGLMFIGLLGLASISLAAEGIWTRKADMPTARGWMASAVVDGKIYAIGGFANWAALSTVEVYDTKTDTWAKKANIPTARLYFSAAVLNGMIYAIGGMLSPDNVPINLVEAYNPRTDTWTKKADLPTATFGGIGGCAPVVEGKIYLIGAHLGAPGNLSIVQEYDPLADKWTRKTDMPIPRMSFAVSEANKKIYAIGGYRDFWAAVPLPTVDEYNPATDQWVKKADIPTVRGDLSASAVNGIIFVIGGGEQGVFVLPTVEAYNPQTDTWTKEADMPTPRLGLSTCED